MVLKHLDDNTCITELPVSAWREYQAFRLRSLKEEPIAFKNSYRENRACTEKEWQGKLAASQNGAQIKLFFLKRGRKIIGMIGVLFDLTEKRRHIATMVDVYVASKFRGHGFGKALLEFALTDIKKKTKRIRKVQLSVTASQKAAVRLYAHCGFEIVGCAREEKKVDSIYYDQYLMEKFL